MAKEPSDEAFDTDAELLADWLRHPWTTKLMITLDKESDAAKRLLNNACVSTSDPKVAAAHQKFEQTKTLKELLSGKSKRGK